MGNFLRVPKLWLFQELFYITINIHLIKLLKLKATPKFGMKLYLKWLFSGKLNLWTEYPKFPQLQIFMWRKERNGRNLTKTQALQNLLFLKPYQSSVVVAITNEPHIKCISKYWEERKHSTVKGIYLASRSNVCFNWKLIPFFIFPDLPGTILSLI